MNTTKIATISTNIISLRKLKFKNLSLFLQFTQQQTTEKAHSTVLQSTDKFLICT